MEVLDLSTLRWTVAAALPSCRSDSAACLSASGDIVIAGGDTEPETDEADVRGWSVTQTCVKLNNAHGLTQQLAQQAERLPPMQTERTTFRLVRCLDGRLLAIGGCDDAQRSASGARGKNGLFCKTYSMVTC